MNDFEKWESEFNQPIPAEDELPEWVDSILEDHFVPPDPGQTPKLKTQTRKGVFTLISGIVVLIVSPFFNFGFGPGPWIVLGTISLFTGAFWLYRSIPDVESEPEEDSGNGAIL